MRNLSIAALFACVALAPTTGHAAEAEVTAPESPVRTAPFNVAPELARVHAGDKLVGDDQPQGEWRRVRLPDGRWGFLREADAKITAAPPPPTLNVSPETLVAGASPKPGEPAPGAPVPVVAQQPVTPAEPQTGPTLLGVMFELLPVGTLKQSATLGTQTANTSFDSAVAVAVAPFLDIAASPYFAIGLSPQIVFRVRGDSGGGGESATEYDLRARFTARAPLAPNARAYARFSPAYSIVSLPDNGSNAMPPPKPAGLLLDFAVGAEVALLPNLFLVIDIGYQLGFQSATTSDGLATFDGTRYLHLGGGLAIGL